MSESIGRKIIDKETNETITYSSNYKAAEACSEGTIRNYNKNCCFT